MMKGIGEWNKSLGELPGSFSTMTTMITNILGSEVELSDSNIEALYSYITDTIDLNKNQGTRIESSDAKTMIASISNIAGKTKKRD
jgi:hypothetical protein